MMDLEKAINQGLDIVMAEERLDLGAEEAFRFYERFLERAKTQPLLDAVVETVHDAYLIGLAMGRNRHEENTEH